MAAEVAELKASLERIARRAARAVVGALTRRCSSMFELVVASAATASRVAEARDGICTICHVRLRPQVFNTVRRNEEIIQCDSCNRILYFVPAAAPRRDAAGGRPGEP